MIDRFQSLLSISTCAAKPRNEKLLTSDVKSPRRKKSTGSDPASPGRERDPSRPRSRSRSKSRKSLNQTEDPGVEKKPRLSANLSSSAAGPTPNTPLVRP